ncbi:MAG: MBL fold metallo-hydrolase [Desulfatiglans sp.]|nr:MBL fold metallo-hydrolase [Desulfatiglans sp.]
MIKELIRPFPETRNITPIPIPFNEVPYLLTANIYALGKEEITLIDAGPDIPGALQFIMDTFKREGLIFNNINRIILTHGHMDHFGLASEIIKRLDHTVEIYIHPEGVWKISSEFLKNEIWADELDLLQQMAGIPDDILNAMKRGIRKYYSIAKPIDEPKEMADGHIFKGEGYSLRVIFTPGHDPGLCCLYESEQKILFSSDHIIKNLTPKPILALSRDRMIDKNYKGLIYYLKSLDRVSGLDVRHLFPGHGEYISDMKPVIGMYRVHYKERMEQVLNAVKDEELPAYNMVRKIFPNVEKADVFIALSEIFSHLELLESDNKIEIKGQDFPIIYRAL